MNIFLGLTWILLGSGLLLYEPITGNPGPGIKLGDSTLNAGWLALLLAGWNGARLWSSFSFQKNDQMPGWKNDHLFFWVRNDHLPIFFR